MMPKSNLTIPCNLFIYICLHEILRAYLKAKHGIMASLAS